MHGGMWCAILVGMNETLRVGDEVVVGKRFTMDLGMVADEYTGRRMVVVVVRPATTYGPESCGLAPAGLVGVDESDEVVDVVSRRLTKTTKAEG